MIYSNLFSLACKLQGILGLDPSQKGAEYCYGTMAQYMVYACNYDAEVMYQVIPDFGVSEVVRKAIIKDELSREHNTTWPAPLLRAQSEILIEGITTKEPVEEAKLTPDSGEIIYDASALPLPRLPYLLQLLTDHEEEPEFKAPLVMAMLPVLGSLATSVRFMYDAGEPAHSFSFLACIVGDTSGGKSFVKRYVDLLTTPYMDEEDRLAPHVTSITALLDMLDSANGKHVFAFYPELGVLLSQKRRGAWANLDQLLCMSFDNDIFRQRFISRGTWSGEVKVFYNLLATGTPDKCREFFHSGAIEDGLQNRFAFVQMPNRFAKPRRSVKAITEKELYEIGCIAMWLMEQSETIECPAVLSAIDKWLEEKRKLALSTGSKAIDTYRKRSAVIGFRAGMLCYLLEQERSTLSNEDIAKFATWVAEYVFCNHMAMFGEQMDSQAEKAKTINGHAIPYILLQLPHRFTRDEVSALQIKNGNSNSNPKQNISAWKKLGCIREVEKGKVYEKVV